MRHGARLLNARPCRRLPAWGLLGGIRPLGFPHHPDEHCSERPILLAVDVGRRTIWSSGSPERADPVDPVEVGEAQDVDEFGASRRWEGFEASSERGLGLDGRHGRACSPWRRLRFRLETRDGGA
jgi:hypothetical protein